MRRYFDRHPIDPLLVLRTVACLLVVGSHVQRAELHAEELHLGWNWLTVIDGHFGVWIFFILSGYLIGKGYVTGRYQLSIAGLSDFYARRLSKVYFPYVLTAAVAFFLLKGTVPLDKMRDVVLLHGERVYNYDEISYLWTISNIVEWYLIAPFVAFLFLPLLGKKIPVFIVGLAILIYGISMRWLFLTGNPVTNFPEYNIAVYIQFLPNLDFFLFGLWLNFVLVGKWTAREEQWWHRARWVLRGLSGASLAVAFIVATYYLAAVYEWQQWSYQPYALGATTATLLSAGGFVYVWEREQYDTRRPRFHWSLFTPLLWIGTYSYQIYLMQSPIIKLLQLQCQRQMLCSLAEVWYHSLLVMVIAIVVAVVTQQAWRVSISRSS